MKTTVGLWLDHRKAVIVAISDQGQATKLVISKVEEQLGRPGGRRSTTAYEPQQVPSDDRRQRKLTGQLNIYYEAVIACLRDAEAILIFGPGEAKGELKKRLEKSGLRGRIAAVETFDKMTDRQIAARVRQYFAE